MPGTGEEEAAAAAEEGAGARTVSLSPALPVFAVPKWERERAALPLSSAGPGAAPGGTGPGRTGHGAGGGHAGPGRAAGAGSSPARDTLVRVRVGMLEQVPVLFRDAEIPVRIGMPEQGLPRYRH